MSAVSAIPALSILCRRCLFVNAIRKGDAAEVTRLIKEDASLVNDTELGNRQSKDKRTALHFACTGGHLEVVKLLLDCGADLEARAEFWRTPFLFACLHGRLEIMKHLANRGCNMKAVDSLWISNAFHLACLSGNLESVLWLMSCGFDIKQTEAEEDGASRTGLHLACEEGYLAVAENLIGCGLHIELRDENGFTPFLCAARSGNCLLIKWLKEKGCNVGVKNKYGCNALHEACRCSHAEAAKYLIENCSTIKESQKRKPKEKDIVSSIDLEDETNDGETALMLASGKGWLSFVKLLVSRKCGLDHKDWEGRTALHYGCLSGSAETVEFLLTSGLDIDKKDYGKTPYCTKLSNIAHGATTPLLMAIERNHSDVVKLLLKKNCDIYIKKNGVSKSSLHYACSLKSGQIAHMLIDRDYAGVMLDEADESQVTPVSEACLNGFFQLLSVSPRRGVH